MTKDPISRLAFVEQMKEQDWTVSVAHAGPNVMVTRKNAESGGPIMLGAELFLNKVSFTGDKIVNRDIDTASEQAAGYADWLWKSWMPSAPWIPNGWYWEKIGKAAGGGQTTLGTPYSLPLAMASSMGIKLERVNVEEGKFWKAKGYEKKQKKSEMR